MNGQRSRSDIWLSIGTWAEDGQALEPAGLASRADTGPATVGRIALAHDYLNQRGGAERVALELARIFPHAPLYTSLYRAESTFPEFRNVDVRPSYLNWVSVDAAFRALLPLYPSAFAALGPISADILLASSSGWAHALRVKPPGRLVVYCHNPARWLYGQHYLGGSSAKQRVAAPLLSWLRRWDLAAARRADLYIANSRVTQARIRSTYGIDALVIPPPVDVDRFTPSPRGERLLVVSRLLPYKRVDLVVQAATQAGIGLDVVGEGPSLSDLRREAGSSVTFHGRVDDATVTELMQNCRALCLPGLEDFGITPVEAQAAGKPVIAFGAGGALETVEPGLTGTFFAEQDVDAFLDAVRRCESIATEPRHIAQRAHRFSRQAFHRRIEQLVADLTNTSS
jgi:glycosyltransferase involved in cell wall biosynthesis